MDDDTNLNLGFTRYENTSLVGNNKYQYVLPNFNFTKSEKAIFSTKNWYKKNSL